MKLQRDDTDVSRKFKSVDLDIDFSVVDKRNAKAKDTRNLTILEKNDKTFYVCDCGFSATSRSGSARHKCKKSTDIEFPCSECGLICRNQGSLKRHFYSKHGKSSSSNELRSSGNDFSVLILYVYILSV